MKPLRTVTLFDEPTCMAVIDSPIEGWVQQRYGSCGTSLLPVHFKDSWPILKWTGQILSYPERPRPSFQDAHRVGLIDYLRQKLMPNSFTTTDLRQCMESYLGPLDGTRLPLPQVIRRRDRMGHEAQKTSGENGGDDD